MKVPTEPTDPLDRSLVLHLRTFAWVLSPFAFGFGLVYAATAVSLGRPSLWFGAVLSWVVTGTNHLGVRLASKGQASRGSLTMAYGLLASAFGYVFVVPNATPTLAVMSIAAVALCLRCVQGRALTTLVIIATAVACATIIVGVLSPPAGLPRWFERMVLISTFCMAVLLTHLLLWRFSQRLHEMLARALTLNEQVRDSERKKDNFLAVLGHELRNPLAPIQNAVALLQRMPPESEEALAQRQIIAQEVWHMTRLLDDLLDLGRIAHGKVNLAPEVQDVRELVETAANQSRQLLERRRHRFVLDSGPAGLAVRGDRVRLVQVITNLLRNAADYTPEGGSISLLADGDGTTATIRVCDTGPGIPAELREKIFDPFVQLGRALYQEQGGLGLGLTLVKQFTELHGGTVRIRSDGNGSEFSVVLPALPPGERPSAPAAAARPWSGANPASGVRVLVVDDNINAARTLSMFLALSGNEAKVAHDGPSALELAQQWRPTVVLLDLGLPGMDGFEVARLLRATPDFGDLRIIAVSGYGQEQHRVRAKEAGIDLHFVKPVAPELLAEAIASSAA